MRCARQGCDNTGNYYPHLMLPAYPGGPEAAMTFHLATCDECQPKIEIGDVMGDEGWQAIAQAMMKNGIQSPDRSLVYLKWVIIQ